MDQVVAGFRIEDGWAICIRSLKLKNFSIPGILSIKGPGQVILQEGASFRSSFYDEKKAVTLYTYTPEATIQIGQNSKLIGTRLGAAKLIHIGNSVLIEEASIRDLDFHGLGANQRTNSYRDEPKAVSIGDDCKIASFCNILKGVSIGDNVVVLPHSVVVRDLEPDLVVFGMPARPVR